MMNENANYGDVVFDWGSGAANSGPPGNQDWATRSSTVMKGAMLPGNGFVPMAEGRLLTQGAVRELGKQLFVNIRREWEENHTNSGESIKAMHLIMGAMSVTIQLPGPFLLVEGGFREHTITVNPPKKSLYWPEGNFAYSVFNPGYAGDPYVERAMDELNYDVAFRSMAAKVFTSIGSRLSAIASAMSDASLGRSASEDLSV